MSERDCKHGRLARSCETCAAEDRIAQLEREAQELRERLCDESLDKEYFAALKADLAREREANAKLREILARLSDAIDRMDLKQARAAIAEAAPPRTP